MKNHSSLRSILDFMFKTRGSLSRIVGGHFQTTTRGSLCVRISNIVCNSDLKPGYAGVENPLYSREKGVFLELDDAKETLMRLMVGIA